MGSSAYSALVGKKQGKDPFHAPFARLKERLAPVKAAEPPRPAPPPPPTREASDGELWASAVAGVERLEPGPGRAGPPPPSPPADAFWHPDLDAIRALEALVSGDAPFDLSDSDEFIEGRVPGLDANIVRRLRRGEAVRAARTRPRHPFEGPDADPEGRAQALARHRALRPARPRLRHRASGGRRSGSALRAPAAGGAGRR